MTLASINSSHISKNGYEPGYQVRIQPPKPQNFYDLPPQPEHSPFSVVFIAFGLYGVSIRTVAIFNKILTGN